MNRPTALGGPWRAAHTGRWRRLAIGGTIAIALGGGGCQLAPSQRARSFSDASPSPAAIADVTNTSSPEFVEAISPDRGYAIAFPKPTTWTLIPAIEAKYDDGARFYFVRGDRVRGDRVRGDQLNDRLSPASTADVRAYLEAAMPGVALLFGSQHIAYSEAIALGDYPGRRMMFENATGIQFEARLFFDPQTLRLFVVAFGTIENNLAVPEAERFFRSFRILDPNATAATEPQAPPVAENVGN